MIKRYALFLACLAIAVALPSTSWAQGRTVSGTVTSSDDGSPLPGASVVVKGTTVGTATNPNGRYELELTADQFEGGVLRFTYVGFVAREVPIDGRSEINVELRPDYQQLSEVVVTGYGSQIQKDVTGNISRVSAEEIEFTPVNSIESTLQGRSAGVYIENSSGKLGQGIKVRIRGSSSISADNQPLYVVDGIPVTTQSLSSNGAPTNPLADLNFNDVESVEILKDASASAIYGARASNGVVLITTKSGSAGDTQFNVNYQMSSSEPTNRVEFLNAEEYVTLFREAAQNSTDLTGDPFFVNFAEDYFNFLAQGTDFENQVVDNEWQDGAFQDATGIQFDLSARGGNEQTQFYVSGSYSQQDGILFRDEFDRITGRVNVDHTFNEWLTIGGKLSLGRTFNTRISNDNAFSNPMQLVAQPPISPIYTPAQDNLPGYTPTDELNPSTLYFNGLLYGRGNVRYNTEIFRSLGNAYAQLQLLPSLRFRSEFGIDVLDQNEDEYYNSQVARNTGAPNGLGFNTWNRVVNYNTNNFLNYTETFGQVHDVEGTLGMSFQSAITDQVFVQGEEFPNDDFGQIASAADITGGSSSETSYRFLSYFARVNYKFADKYLLTVSGRVDGSSRFGADNRYGFFPAGSVGWILTEESFMRDQDLFSFLKLRASYGLTGNAEISNFAPLGLYGASGYGGRSGIVPSQTPNPDLKWEQTAQFNVGLDFGFWNNRINGEVDYYVKNTEDLLLNVNVPATTGFLTQTRNVGKLENKGFEFVLNTNNIVNEDFSWSTNFNIGFNRNKITDLNGQVIEGGFINRAVEGEPIGVFFGWDYAGVDPDNGDALYYVNEMDADGNIVNPEATTNNPNEANRVVIGDPNPDFTGGFGNEFRYKNFDLNVFFQFVSGNEIFDGGGRFKSASADFFDNQSADQLDRWQEPGDQTDVPQARLLLGNGTVDSDRYIYDGSYIRLKNVTFGYRVPQSLAQRINLNNARLYVTGVNLLTFTDYPWWDPEVNADFAAGNLGQGNEFYSAPQARTISAGIQFSF